MTNVSPPGALAESAGTFSTFAAARLSGGNEARMCPSSESAVDVRRGDDRPSAVRRRRGCGAFRGRLARFERGQLHNAKSWSTWPIAAQEAEAHARRSGVGGGHVPV